MKKIFKKPKPKFDIKPIPNIKPETQKKKFYTKNYKQLKLIKYFKYLYNWSYLASTNH